MSKQPYFRNISQEKSRRIAELEAENEQLRSIKCPPISDGDSCICPIEELEGENKAILKRAEAAEDDGLVDEERIKELEEGGYIRHKHNCKMGEYNTILTGEGCSCGLSQILKGK